MSRRQQVAERRVEALRMRREGKRYQAIADALGYASPQAASRDVHRALQGAVMEAGRAMLDLERDRLDATQERLWHLLVNAQDERTQVAAGRELVQLFARRARLLGLDRAAADRMAAEGAESARGVLGNFAAALQTAYDALPDQD